jgi:hypothetical protein
MEFDVYFYGRENNMKPDIKIPLFFVFLAFVGMGLLAGCKPVCEEASLQKPEMISPIGLPPLSDLQPSFHWNYPNPNCDPESYRINLSSGPLFEENIGGGTGNPQTSWGPGEPLQPHTEYHWSVQAFVGSTLGPKPATRYFFTGPVCTENLVAPILVKPADKEVVNSTNVMFYTDYPGDCLAPGYYFKLASDPQFSNIVEFLKRDVPLMFYNITGLTDCMTYYWNVAAQINGVKGPFSPTYSVRVDVNGSCPAPLTLEKSLFYCVDEPVSFMAEFYFDQPMEGNFETHFQDSIYPCILDPENANRLICYGPRTESNSAVTLQLVNMDTGEAITSVDAKTPDCTAAAIQPENLSSGNNPDCSTFTSKLSCESSGCYWKPLNDLVSYCSSTP